MAADGTRIESTDHRTNALLRGVLVLALAFVYVLRLRGRPLDGIDLFFGVVILGLAAVAAAYGVSHVRAVPGGIEVRNGPRRLTVRTEDVVGTGVTTLASRRAREEGPVDWQTTRSPSYLTIQLVGGEEVVAYGVALEPSLRRRSAGPEAFLETVARVRAHLGLPPLS